MKRSNWFICLLFICSMLCAQKVNVYKIDELLKRINNSSDTVYVVNFWATWCKPCVEELPEFEKFNRQNKTRIVKIILVTLDFKEEKENKVIPFLKKNKYSMEVVLLDEVNGNDFINKIDSKWSGAIPATLFTVKNKSKTLFFEKKLDLEKLNSAYIDF